tara:strand:- start:1577 stop:1858 length:282 start_codon:yes stop_codon:yes gene_type:complete
MRFRAENYDTTILQSRTCDNIVTVIKSLLRMVNKSDIERTTYDKNILKNARQIIRKHRQASDRMKSIHAKHHLAQLKRNENKRLKEDARDTPN